MTKNKKKYRINNWSSYNNSLKQRGTIEIWINDDILDKWKAVPSGKPGAQPIYSDLAIQVVLQIGKVFHQKLRQSEGLLENVFKLMGVAQSVPDYSTVSRRSFSLNVMLTKKVRKSNERKIVVIDSTGLKVYGEGEWKVRQHGISKRRTWRKAHLIASPDGEILAAKLTENNIADCDAFVDLLNQVTGKIDSLAGDGGYDKEKVYQACVEKKIKHILIPPQKNAKIKFHGNLNSEPHPRDENLRQIRKTTRKQWKKESGYHVRSLAETTMFRFKTIFGDRLNARKFENQVTEFLTAISVMNKMTKLGMPDSYSII
ncbi:MAG: IS5 family transposase [Candidatus Magasanikbacteria bacterium]|nr:IS5 family transposase [Candidatus Magasanikbacteria bacterium]